MRVFIASLVLALLAAPSTLLAQQPSQPLQPQQPQQPRPAIPTTPKGPGGAPAGAVDGGFPASLPPPDATIVPSTNATLAPASGAAATPLGDTGSTTYTFIVPPNGGGNGTCSPMNVTSLTYSLPQSATTPFPSTIQAVLACNKPAFDALLPANISDPAVAALPPPLPELSCFPDAGEATIRNCSRSFPPNRRLRPQTMCVLVKNGGSDPIAVTVVVNWGLPPQGAGAGNASNGTNVTGGGEARVGRAGVVVSLMGVLASAYAMV